MRILIIFLSGVIITFSLDKLFKSNLIFQIGIVLTIIFTICVTIHDTTISKIYEKNNITVHDGTYNENELKPFSPPQPPRIGN